MSTVMKHLPKYTLAAVCTGAGYYAYYHAPGSKPERPRPVTGSFASNSSENALAQDMVTPPNASTINKARGHLRIVAVNDVYKVENLARLKTLVDDMKEEIPPGAKLITTCAGDFLSPCLLSALDKGVAMIEGMNMVPIDYLCFGNHEADAVLTMSVMRQRIKEFNGVWLNTNMEEYAIDMPRYDVIDVGGHRVGLLGLLMNDESIYMPGRFGGAYIEDIITSALKWTQHLRENEGCDEIIPLTHQSFQDDLKLAETEGLAYSLILGGHEHTVFNQIVNDSCRVFKAGVDAEHAGIFDFIWHQDGTKTIKFKLLDIEDYAPDAALQARMEERMKIVDSLKTVPLFKITANNGVISSVGTRHQKCTAATVYASAMRGALGSDIAVLHGGNLRAQKEYQNNYMFSDLMGEFTFSGCIVIAKLPGRVIQDMIRFSHSKVPDDYSGFIHTCDAVKMNGKTDTITSVRGEPFDANRIYTVAIERAITGGMDNIVPLVEYCASNPSAVPPAEVGIPIKEVIVGYYSSELMSRLGQYKFDDLDIDGDGKINVDELMKAVCKLHAVGTDCALPEWRMKNLLGLVDDDGSGYITKEEYYQFQRSLEEEEKHMLHKQWSWMGTFEDMDIDGDGVITKDEVIRRAREEMDNDQEFSQAEINAWFDNVDSNSDGTICKKEFAAFKRRLIQAKQEKLFKAKLKKMKGE